MGPSPFPRSSLSLPLVDGELTHPSLAPAGPRREALCHQDGRVVHVPRPPVHRDRAVEHQPVRARQGQQLRRLLDRPHPPVRRPDPPIAVAPAAPPRHPLRPQARGAFPPSLAAVSPSSSQQHSLTSSSSSSRRTSSSSTRPRAASRSSTSAAAASRTRRARRSPLPPCRSSLADPVALTPSQSTPTSSRASTARPRSSSAATTRWPSTCVPFLLTLGSGSPAPSLTLCSLSSIARRSGLSAASSPRCTRATRSSPARTSRSSSRASWRSWASRTSTSSTAARASASSSVRPPLSPLFLSLCRTSSAHSRPSRYRLDRRASPCRQLEGPPTPSRLEEPRRRPQVRRRPVRRLYRQVSRVGP